MSLNKCLADRINWILGLEDIILGGFDERFEVGFLENQNRKKRGTRKYAEPSNRQTSSGGGFPAEPHLVLELVSSRPPIFCY